MQNNNKTNTLVDVSKKERDVKKMKTMKLQIKSAFAAALFLVFVINVFGQGYQSISPKTKQKIDSTYLSLVKKNKIVGASIAIIDNGKIVYSTGYGYADAEAKKPATDSTIYRIGSITKSFTALSVLQLHERSEININRQLNNYLPDFSIKNQTTGQNQDIIIKDIFPHISGMPCDIMNGFFATSPPDQKWAISQLNKQYTIAPAGYMMAYSNVGYALLGELIARTSKMPYEEYLLENIFKPLNMNSSGVNFSQDNNRLLAKGYINGNPSTEPYLRDVAAGLIHSNVLDMSNYILMYLNKGRFNDTEILNDTLIAMMQKNWLKDIRLNNEMQYGYGLFIEDLIVKNMETKDSTRYTYIGHGGDTYAFHANFGFIPGQGIGAVILTNTDKGKEINDIPDLLNVYLKHERGLELSHVKNNGNSVKNRNIVQSTNLNGDYTSMFGLINAESGKKIKFKQGPVKIVLKQADEMPVFTGKALLFGFIPFKIKDLEFFFEQIDDNIFMKGRIPSTREEEFLGIKAEPQVTSTSWKNALGKYKLTGEMFAVPAAFPFNTIDARAELKTVNDFIIFSLETSVRDIKISFPLKIINDTDAVGYSYGRNTGYTVLLLPDNKLYFSGFTFERNNK